MLGKATPLYRIIYYLPLLNRFRVPSRHTFEWTFAAGVLAAYGWDALAPILRRRRAEFKDKRALTLYAALALLALSVAVGAAWWFKAQTLQLGIGTGWHAPKTVYRLWKIAFLLLTTAALWRASLIYTVRWRHGLLAATVLVLCFVEPSLLITRWWGGMGLSADRFTWHTDVTRYLQQFPPTENRVYTRVALMTEQFSTPPRFDGANLSAIWGLHNVAGYEPLIFERYSRALGGAYLDAVHTVTLGAPDRTLLGARSHVLDILNTTYLVSYKNLATSPSSSGEPGVERRDASDRRTTAAGDEDARCVANRRGRAAVRNLSVELDL